MALKKAGRPIKNQNEEDGPEGRRPFNTTLNAGLVLKAQVECLRLGCSMNDIIEELLAGWLGEKSPARSGDSR